MSARNWQELRDSDMADPKAMVAKLNDAFRDLNTRIGENTERRAVDVKTWSFSIGAAVTTIDSPYISFAFPPKAVVVGSCVQTDDESVTCEAVNAIDWVSLRDTTIKVRAVNGVAINTLYTMVLVAYGQ